MNPVLRNLLIGAGLIVGVVILFRRTDEQREADAALGFTDIPGPIDELGAVTNRISGGLLARLGSFIGGTAADIVGIRANIERATPEQIANF